MNGGNNKSRSENEGLDRCNNTWNEIEAGDVRDGENYQFRSTIELCTGSFWLLVINVAFDAVSDFN